MTRLIPNLVYSTQHPDEFRTVDDRNVPVEVHGELLITVPVGSPELSSEMKRESLLIVLDPQSESGNKVSGYVLPRIDYEKLLDAHRGKQLGDEIVEMFDPSDAQDQRVVQMLGAESDNKERNLNIGMESLMILNSFAGTSRCPESLKARIERLKAAFVWLSALEGYHTATGIQLKDTEPAPCAQCSGEGYDPEDQELCHECSGKGVEWWDTDLVEGPRFFSFEMKVRTYVWCLPPNIGTDLLEGVENRAAMLAGEETVGPNDGDVEPDALSVHFHLLRWITLKYARNWPQLATFIAPLLNRPDDERPSSRTLSC